MHPNPASPGVPAVEKCLAIIRLLDMAGDAGISLASVAAQLGLTKSHGLQILRTLVAQGWAIHDPERQRYALAAGLMLDLAVTLRRSQRETVVQAVLDRLTRALGLPCILTRANRDGSFSCIGKAEPNAELMVSAPIGHRFPADAPAQLRARLAALPEAEAARALDDVRLQAHTAATVTDKARVLSLVAEARARGYALGRGEYLDGIQSMTTALHRGAAVMILQCTGPVAIMQGREAQIGGALCEAADKLRAAWDLPSRRPTLRAPRVELT
ncbi:IclR family transcriptional regulator [Pseudoroseomonas globiformis]|uniref:IclR family transcriptional regulator n=1 Tax=Teichococcus globiformis TaxID=2307229 RepID=A0ABV7G3U0_9PROT